MIISKDTDNEGISKLNASPISARTVPDDSRDEENISSNNGRGFAVEVNTTGAAATIRVSHSTATNNTDYGFLQSGTEVFESLGNNLVRGNGAADTSGPMTVIMAQ